MDQAIRTPWNNAGIGAWRIELILAVGAMIWSILALTIGNRPLPSWIKHVSIGALAALAMVVLLKMMAPQVLSFTGKRHGKLHGAYLEVGLYAVPVILLAGGTIGLVIGRLRSMRALRQATPSR
jgi:hypothetical protein